MTHDSLDDALLRRFLVADVTPDEQERVEEALMFEEGVLDRLEALELEMMNDYLRGTLTPEWRERAERAFEATPARRQLLEEQRQLILALEAEPPRAAVFDWFRALWSKQVVIPVSAAAILLLVVSVSRRGTTRTVTPAPDQPATVERTPIEQILEIRPAVRSATDSGNIHTINRNTETATLRFTMLLEPIDRPTFSVRPDAAPPLSPPSAPMISRLDSKLVEVRWSVPASVLRPGDYTLVATTDTGTGPRLLMERPFTILP
jgi:hypothetical protein